jgi:hypothetical protein
MTIKEEFIKVFSQGNECVWAAISTLIHDGTLTDAKMREWLIKQRYPKEMQKVGAAQAQSNLSDDYGISDRQVRRIVTEKAPHLSTQG